MRKPKANINKAKDVETKPARPVLYKLPEPLRQAVLNYISNSIPRNMTVQEVVVKLAMPLQKLEKVQL